MRLHIAILLITTTSLLTARAEVSRTWNPDCGDGTYINPIIHADYSDPDVIAVGDDYWMTASSFQCVPGLPILHSRDLVNWDIVNYALDALVPDDYYSTPRHGKGVWAPSLRYHDGEYYIYWGDPDFGIYMVKTADPRGSWSEPLLVKAGNGMIDPTPLWDDDGRAYLVNGWAGSRAGFNSVLTVWQMTPDGTSLTGTPAIVFDGNDGVNHTVEGPKFYKRDGYYYILCPAGGVVDGWQLALRSRSPFGPYESKIVMESGDTGINGPHQGGMVDTPAGESWFINFQDKGLYGRVLHLNPVTWTDGWPIMGDNGKPVSRHAKPRVNGAAVTPVNPPESDSFASRTLGRQWEWHANYRPTYGMTSDLGFVRIYGHRMDSTDVNFWSVPNLLLQKFPAPAFTATAHATVSAKAPGNRSGLIVMGHDYARLSIEKRADTDGFDIRLITCTDAEQGGRETATDVATVAPTRVYAAGLHPNYELELWLRVTVADGGLCRFYYSLDGRRWHPAGSPFQARQGKWIGAKTGLFSVTPAGTDRGWIDTREFIIDK